MARTSRTARRVAALELALEEGRHRSRLERDEAQRYYDRIRAELTMQRGLI